MNLIYNMKSNRKKLAEWSGCYRHTFIENYKTFINTQLLLEIHDESTTDANNSSVGIILHHLKVCKAHCPFQIQDS